MYLRKSFLPRHSEFPFVDLEVSLTDFLAENLFIIQILQIHSYIISNLFALGKSNRTMNYFFFSFVLEDEGLVI
jgi:hypothetical protein